MNVGCEAMHFRWSLEIFDSFFKNENEGKKVWQCEAFFVSWCHSRTFEDIICIIFSLWSKTLTILTDYLDITQTKKSERQTDCYVKTIPCHSWGLQLSKQKVLKSMISMKYLTKSLDTKLEPGSIFVFFKSQKFIIKIIQVRGKKNLKRPNFKKFFSLAIF